MNIYIAVISKKLLTLYKRSTICYKNMDPQKFWRCKNVLEVLYHHAKFGGARISPATGVAKNVEFFVCLSVPLLNVRVCAHDFVIKAFEMILMPLDRGRFVVVHSCSTFSDCRQPATPQNAEVQKTAKSCFFFNDTATTEIYTE